MEWGKGWKAGEGREGRGRAEGCVCGGGGGGGGYSVGVVDNTVIREAVQATAILLILLPLQPPV